MRKLTVGDVVATLIAAAVVVPFIGSSARGPVPFVHDPRGFGVAALIAEAVWVLVVPMVAGLVLMWALALMHDGGYVAPGHAAGHSLSSSPGVAGSA